MLETNHLLSPSRFKLFKILFLNFIITECLACRSPPSVDHATVSISTVQMTPTDTLQIATYTCDFGNGYATRGNNTIACLKVHGYYIWTAVQVTCESEFSFIYSAHSLKTFDIRCKNLLISQHFYLVSCCYKLNS